MRAGAGDLVASAKYRFLEASEDRRLPDAAVFPAVTVPTGSQRFDTLRGTLFMTRRFGERLDFGVEIYHQTVSVPGGFASTHLGFGAIYQITTHWALMASGGPGLQNSGRAGSSAFYFSLQFKN